MTEEKGKNLDSNTESQPALSLFGIPVKIIEDWPLPPTLINLDAFDPKNYRIKLMEKVEGNTRSYFIRAIDQIMEMHKRKASDYTDSGEFDNFIESAQSAGIETYQAIENLIGTKEARIRVLRKKAREGYDASNEPLIDSYLDRAVYAIISYAYELMVSENSIQSNSVTSAKLSIDDLTPESEARCRNCNHPKSQHLNYIRYLTGCKCCAANHYD
jgi:hypothetical protein